MPNETYDIDLIINELEAQLLHEYNEDIRYMQLHCPEGEKESEQEYLNGEYKANLEKLSIVMKVIMEQKENPYFFEMLDKIGETAPNPKASVTTRLTLGTMIKGFERVKDAINVGPNSPDGLLGPDELLMLARSFSQLDVDDIGFYGTVLTEPELARAITVKTSSCNEQVKIAGEIMDGPMDEYPGDFVSCDDFTTVLAQCQSLVENYEIQPSKTK